MLNNIFTSIITNGTFTGTEFAIATVTALVCGFIIAASYIVKNKCSRSFVITLVLLPAIVELVIILVNGNIGAGIAVAGAFSLVRFRSLPGTAKEIASIFLAMAIGLATGMGYIGIAVIFFIIVALVMLCLTMLHFGQGDAAGRILKITIPENLDYEGLFDDLFEKYLKSYSLDKIKTSNMGTLFELQYQITLKDNVLPKKFFDELRCRNGNLNIICSKEADRDLL